TALVNVAALVRRGNTLLVGQLPADAPRWPSMWQLPNVNLEQQETETSGLTRALRTWCGTTGTLGPRVASLQHSVTRYRITVNVFEVSLDGAPTACGCQA